MTPYFKTFLAAIVAVSFLAVAVIGHAAEPVAPKSDDVPQLVIVVGFENGVALGAQVLGISDSLEGCQKGVMQAITQLQAKPGVQLVAVCTPLPPAPPATKHQGEASI